MVFWVLLETCNIIYISSTPFSVQVVELRLKSLAFCESGGRESFNYNLLVTCLTFSFLLVIYLELWKSDK